MSFSDLGGFYDGSSSVIPLGSGLARQTIWTVSYPIGQPPNAAFHGLGAPRKATRPKTADLSRQRTRCHPGLIHLLERAG